MTFPATALRERVAEVEIERLRKALAFATSVIKCGEPWTGVW